MHRNSTSWSVWRTERSIWNRAYRPQFRQKRKRSRSPAGPRRLGTATRISASLSRRLSAFFGSTHDQAPKAAKFAVLNPGHAGFPNRVERSEGSDTTPHLARSESTAHRVKKQQHHQVANRSRSPAGSRRLGTATRISASLSRRLSAFFESTSRPRSQSGKVRRSDTRPGDVRERAECSEGSDSAPVRNAPCFGVRAAVCDSLSEAECVPAFARESEHGPFVREAENAIRSSLEQRCGGNFLAIFAGTVLSEKPNFTGGFFER